MNRDQNLVKDVLIKLFISLSAFLFVFSIWFLEGVNIQFFLLITALAVTASVFSKKLNFIQISNTYTSNKIRITIYIFALLICGFVSNNVYKFFFFAVMHGGDTPHSVKVIYDLIPLNANIKNGLIYFAFVVFSFVISISLYYVSIGFVSFSRIMVLDDYSKSRNTLFKKIELLSKNIKSLKVIEKYNAFVFLTFVFIVTFFGAYRAYLDGSDSYWHSIWAAETSFPYIDDQPYPLWHILVKGLFRLHIPLRTSASIVTALTNTFLSFLMWKFVSTKTGIDKITVQVITVILLTVYPVWIYWLNPFIYKPAVSPNPWHNPTTFMVKPFAFLAFFYFVYLFDKFRTQKDSHKKDLSIKEFVVFSLIVLFSNLAKPTFVQVFIPAVALFLVVDLFLSKGKSFLFSVKIAISFIPSGLLSIYQLTRAFDMGDSQSLQSAKMMIGFLHDFGGFGFFPILKYFCLVVMLIAFPIYVICLNPKSFFKETDGKLSVLTFAIGTIEHTLFYEVGREISGDNFVWGKILGAFLLWTVAMIKFIKYRKKFDGTQAYRVKNFVGYLILAMHIISGLIYYYWRLFLPNFWS